MTRAGAILALVSLCLWACKKEEVPKTPNPPLHNATVKIDIRLITDSGVYAPGTTRLRLFESFDDLLFQEDRLFDRDTDSLGKATIAGISVPKVYVRADNLVHGTRIDSVTTPDGTISFLEINYF